MYQVLANIVNHVNILCYWQHSCSSITIDHIVMMDLWTKP